MTVPRSTPVVTVEAVGLPTCGLVMNKDQGLSVATAPLRGASTPQGSVLFVDDHDDTRRVMARLLGQEGYAVTTAGSIAEARQRLAAGPVNYLVVDVELPDGHGCELGTSTDGSTDSPQQVRPRGIAISGHDEASHRERCRSMGFEDYLIKPVRWEDLLAALRRLQ